MNEYYRMGVGDEYVEVCMDWQMTDKIKILWWFREIITEEKLTKELQKQIAEVFDMDSYYKKRCKE